jgi:hypothetical protein
LASGPFTIVNNYLEAAGENIMFGGGDPSIAGLVPSSIRIRDNHLAKPLAWKPDDPAYEGTNWVVKNLLELKNARDVVIDGNTFERNWADDQNGFAILFTPRNQDGASPWSVVKNVDFTNNTVRHTLSGINILGWDNLQESGRTTNIRIRNNVFWDVGAWFLQMLDGTPGVVVEHNAVLSGTGILTVGSASPAGPHTGSVHEGFVFRHNIVRFGTQGTSPAATLEDYAALASQFDETALATGNVLIGGPEGPYPGGNVRVDHEDAVGFVNWNAGNCGWPRRARSTTTPPPPTATTSGLTRRSSRASVCASRTTRWPPRYTPFAPCT